MHVACMSAHNHNMQPADDCMHAAYVCMQATFYDHVQAACIPSVALA